MSSSPSLDASAARGRSAPSDSSDGSDSAAHSMIACTRLSSPLPARGLLSKRLLCRFGFVSCCCLRQGWRRRRQARERARLVEKKKKNVSSAFARRFFFFRHEKRRACLHTTSLPCWHVHILTPFRKPKQKMSQVQNRHQTEGSHHRHGAPWQRRARTLRKARLYERAGRGDPLPRQRPQFPWFLGLFCPT